MTELEMDEFVHKVEEGLHAAQKEMFDRKARLDENVVVGDKEGNTVIMSAKRYLELHPEMRL